MKYKAICFDIDGTLYPQEFLTENIRKMTLLHPIAGARYRKVRKEIRRIQDQGIESFDRLDFNQKEAAAYNMVNKPKSSIEEARFYLDRKYYSHLKKIYSKLPAQPDVVRTFEKIRKAGLKIGVFSDWPLYDKLHKIGVEHLCDFAQSSESDGYLKPSIHAFEKLLYNLKLQGTDVLYVGDSYSKDILGANKAGMDAVLINGKCRKTAEKYSAALAVVSDWKEFDEWLNSVLEEK